MKLIQKIILGVAIFIGVIIAIVFFSAGGTKKAAESIMHEFQAGNYEAVYNNSLMTEEFTFEEFTLAMGIGSELDISTAEKLSWIGLGFENNEKYVYGNFRFTNDSEQVITFWFEEVGDELKLLGITGGAPEDFEE